MNYIWKPKKKILYINEENIYINLVDCSDKEAEIYSIYDLDLFSDKKENWIADFKTKQDVFLFLIEKYKLNKREETGKNQIFENALDYYKFGEILINFIGESYYTSIKQLIIKTGFSRKDITLALKIYKYFENDFEKLKNMSLNEVIIITNKKG